MALDHRGELVFRDGRRVPIAIRRTASAFVTERGVRYFARTGERCGAPAGHHLEVATVCRVAVLSPAGCA